MARTRDEIAAKDNEIYESAKAPRAPITVLSFENMSLLKEPGWQPLGVEWVSGLVMELLIQHGRKRQPDRTDE